MPELSTRLRPALMGGGGILQEPKNYLFRQNKLKLAQTTIIFKIMALCGITQLMYLDYSYTCMSNSTCISVEYM